MFPKNLPLDSPIQDLFNDTKFFVVALKFINFDDPIVWFFETRNGIEIFGQNQNQNSDQYFHQCFLRFG